MMIRTLIEHSIRQSFSARLIESPFFIAAQPLGMRTGSWAGFMEPNQDGRISPRLF